MTDKDKFKPLPKPVSASSRSKPVQDSQSQNAPIQNRPQVKYIDPDDFELPTRSPRKGKRKPPTLSEALAVFFRRLFKRIKRFFIRRSPKQIIHTEHTQQNKRAARLRELRRKKIARVTGFVSLFLVFIAAAILLTVWLTGDNAYAVYFGEDKTKVIGYVQFSEDITNAKIQEQAVARLEESLDAKVKTDQTVTIEPVNTGAANISEYEALIDLVTRSFTYKIAGSALIVKGSEVVVLKSEAEVNAVAERLWEPYKSDSTKNASFVEEWRTETRFVDADELDTIEDALLQLDTKHRALEDYVIKQGETISSIAINNNTTIDKIAENTPGLSDPSRIQPGDIVKLEVTKPYLSVRTVDEVTRKKTIPMQTTVEDNPSQPTSYRKVIQEGRDGETEEVVRITRVNGILESEEVIEERQTVEPITRVEEVGTQG